MKNIIFNTLQYHNILNPMAWEGMSLKKDVRRALLAIGQNFIEGWGFDIPVKDIILTGSNANFNFTSYSDFDVHVVVDMDSVPSASKKFVESYLKARKNLWNQKRKVTVKGFPVEVYAQDDDEILISNGVYSLMTDKWIKRPKKVEAKMDHLAVQEKVNDLTQQIEEALAGGMQEAPMAILRKLSQMRKSALQTAGEFSVENLAFKVLRNNGMIGKLRDALDEYTTRNLTLESVSPKKNKDTSLKVKLNKWKERVVNDQMEVVKSDHELELGENDGETLSELNKETLRSYIKKAESSRDNAYSRRSHHRDRMSHNWGRRKPTRSDVEYHSKEYNKALKMSNKRVKGIDAAKKKLGEENITELSKELLKRYRDEARISGVPTEKEMAPYGHTADDYGPKAAKHTRGAKVATKKIIDLSKKEAKAAKEARLANKESSSEKDAANAARRSKWVAANPEKAKQFGVKEETERLQEAGLTVYGRWKKARTAKIWGWKRNLSKKRALVRSATSKTIDRRSNLSARGALYKKLLRGVNKKKLAYSARKSIEKAVKVRDRPFIDIPAARTQWRSRRRDSRRASGTGVVK